MLKYTGKIPRLPNKQQESAYGDGRPTCNRLLTSGSVGMRIPMGIPVGMGWVWGLKCHPHGSPGYIGLLRLIIGQKSQYHFCIQRLGQSRTNFPMMIKFTDEIVVVK